jgi:parallel beta-helix repeat protein
MLFIFILASLSLTCSHNGINYTRELVPLKHNGLAQSSTPIHISSEYDLQTLGCPGSGTPEDPYIISNYWIEAANGITVENLLVHFTITDCIIWAGRGISIDNAHGFTIENNEFLQFGGFEGISIYGCSDFIIRNNSIMPELSSSVSYEQGISFHESGHGVVEQNVIANCEYAIELGGFNITASENVITSYSGVVGINSFRDDNTISGNQISGFETGLTLNGDNGVIRNNTCYENGIGIMLFGSQRNTITQNTISENSVVGMQLIEASSFNVISENRFEVNDGYGLEFFFTESFGYAPVENPVSNQVFRNLFISNYFGDRQAFEQTGENAFGYNYWSDWTGHDDSNSDGFIDDPYPISGGVLFDNHPLVNESLAYSLSISSIALPDPLFPFFQRNLFLVSIAVSWGVILIVPNAKWFFEDRRKKEIQT